MLSGLYINTCLQINKKAQDFKSSKLSQPFDSFKIKKNKENDQEQASSTFIKP